MTLFEWWKQRETREQYVLAFGILTALFLGSYLALTESLNERTRMRNEIPRLQTDLTWMKSHVLELRVLIDNNLKDTNLSANPLSLASVQDVVSELFLSESLTELSTTSNQDIRISFSKIDYPDLVELMLKLESNTSARIHNVEFLAAENNPGVVGATLTLN